jgi:hypothetical protein
MWRCHPTASADVGRKWKRSSWRDKKISAGADFALNPSPCLPDHAIRSSFSKLQGRHRKKAAASLKKRGNHEA